MKSARYDSIGHGYADQRREDPAIRRLIEEVLGDARTVLNIGAGTGAYEPSDRHVLAFEPSDVMAAQRPPSRVPALRIGAGPLPLRDASVDASMAVLTIHHWDQERERGLRELRRVTRGPVVVLTIDPTVSRELWLMKDYFPEVAALDDAIFPSLETLSEWLGRTRVEPVPVARDTTDRSLLAFWAHPEWVLDPAARAATSGFARMPASVVDRVVDAVRRDLEDGTWDERHGHLRELSHYDAGLRLVVAEPRS
ncbi:MAG: methyltransferase domain-containing protein [Deltaproteobacteria bacterium]|nr:methyltransferase domain-containing protein [Deltaproteobacteria bacterium]